MGLLGEGEPLLLEALALARQLAQLGVQAPDRLVVRRRFGQRVASIVDGCTDAYYIPKPPWRERKQSYLRRLKKANSDTRLVSAADKLNNIRSILSDYRSLGEAVWSRFNGGREGTVWYYRALRDEFLRSRPNREHACRKQHHRDKQYRDDRGAPFGTRNIAMDDYGCNDGECADSCQYAATDIEVVEDRCI